MLIDDIFTILIVVDIFKTVLEAAKSILVAYAPVLSVIIYSEYIRRRQNKRSK